MIEAAIFDLDGVLTDTAKVHEAAWREAFWPHSISHEAYLKYVDGRTREDGIRTFLKSVTPPEQLITSKLVKVVGDQKNDLYLEAIERDGVCIIPENVALAALYKAYGWKIGVASSSRNAKTILERAALFPLVDTLVDGNDVERLGLPSKPAPALFKYCANKMDVRYEDCVVFEDSRETYENVAPAYGVLVK